MLTAMQASGMAQTDAIDITFDFRRDTPPGGDPDALSPTLRRYHRLLWSKPLPSGSIFTLNEVDRGAYLRHTSVLGDFALSSDAVIPSFRKQRGLAAIISRIPTDEWESFLALGYTMGGMMLFPANQVDRKITINGARGFHPRIRDRFDLTVECIRRLYVGEPSPLSATLARYELFCGLFQSFGGYVEFFLLQDMVSPDYSNVQFSAPFNDFATPPVPQTFEAYESYRKRAMDFLHARNQRILAWLAAR
jgi:hypothetical protein